MGKWIVQGLIPVLAAGLVVAGVVFLGQRAREDLRAGARRTVPFADIDCRPPGGLGRADFLTEVQYLAGGPTTLNLLDDGLTAQLADAFARHPWVESVRRVEVLPGRVHVDLAYRTPVLGVPAADQTWADDRSAAGRRAPVPGRVVDGTGVLLPPTVIDPQLPVLRGKVSAPKVRVGAAWKDPRVRAAARTAGLLRPYQDRLGLREFRIAEGSLILRGPSVRILWGRAPGEEEMGEATAAVKLQRLLEYHAGHGGLAGEHDVRPARAAAHSPPSQRP